MATGHTMKIEDSIGFRTFALDCARALGSIVELDSGTTAPDESVIRRYYDAKLSEARKKLVRFDAMTLESADKAAKDAYEKACCWRLERMAEMDALRAKYTDMLHAIDAWVPPTIGHGKLKKFMRKQVETSLHCYCDHGSFPPLPVAQSGEEWLAKQIDAVKSDIAYYDSKKRSAIEKNNKRIAYTKALLESL